MNIDLKLVDLTTTVKKVHPMRGWQWINEGYRYFVPAKSAWILSLLIVVFVVLLARFLIPILQLSLIFINPFIVAGLSLACVAIEKGGKMTPEYLFKGFSSPNKMNIFRYGLLFLVMMIIAQLISSILLTAIGITQEQLTSEITALQNNKSADYQTIMDSPILFKFFIMSLISLLPLIMINLFAPIIIVFSDLTAFQSIKLSFFAGLKNIPALIIYMLIYIIILVLTFVILNFLASLLYMAFGEDSGIASAIYLMTFFGSVLAIISISYSSAYVAFKDIFVGDQI